MSIVSNWCSLEYPWSHSKGHRLLLFFQKLLMVLECPFHCHSVPQPSWPALNHYYCSFQSPHTFPLDCRGFHFVENTLWQTLDSCVTIINQLINAFKWVGMKLILTAFMNLPVGKIWSWGEKKTNTNTHRNVKVSCVVTKHGDVSGRHYCEHDHVKNTVL